MDEKTFLTADILELLVMNQTAIRAAVEELSLWVSQRGAIHIHDNVRGALLTLDMNTEAISASIAALRTSAG